MADEQQDDGDGEEDGKKKGGMLLILLISVLAIGGGVMTPLVVAQLAKPSSANSGEEEAMAEPDPDEEVEFIPFDEVTINLDEARFSSHLLINFSLQVAKSQRAEIEAKIQAKSIVFKNWMQIHLAEKSREDLEGRFGRNRVRREMQDFFNQELFDDGIERIQDVLFEEFLVQ